MTLRQLCSNGKVHPRDFRVDIEKRELCWVSSKKSPNRTTIDIDSIVKISEGYSTNVYVARRHSA